MNTIDIPPTVKLSPMPNQVPFPIVVSLVQESIPPQTPNMQTPVSALGSQPSKALAKELLPAPVGPTMTILGEGYSSWDNTEDMKIVTIITDFNILTEEYTSKLTLIHY